jgi:hypothetical protein
MWLGSDSSLSPMLLPFTITEFDRRDEVVSTMVNQRHNYRVTLFLEEPKSRRVVRRISHVIERNFVVYINIYI